MADFHFQCEKCDQRLDAPEELAAQMIECPACKDTIQVPDRNRPSSPPAPPFPQPANEGLRIVNLRCTGCGAPLDITPDLDVFSCSYCGAQQAVHRSGGTVSLKPLEAAISRVQQGTDRTAAELAIRRLREDLTTLEAKEQQNRASMDIEDRRLGRLWLTLVIATGFLAVTLANDAWIGAGILGVLILLAGYFGHGRIAASQKALSEFHVRIEVTRAETQRELSKQYAILKS